MKHIRATGILLAAALFPLAAYTGDDPLTNRGVNLNGIYHVADIDTVNLFNGNLIIDVPMAAQFPLNGGFSYGIHLVYTGQPWDFPQYERTDPAPPDPQAPGLVWKPMPVPNRRSNAGVGWRVSIGRLISPSDTSNTGCDQGTFIRCADWVYESPDGADHRIGDANPGYSADGTYLRLKSYTVSGITYRELEFPDGMIHRFDDTGKLTAIYTPFDRAADAGPSVSVAYLAGAADCGDPDASCWKISDTLGRTQFVTFVHTDGAIYGHDLAQKITVTAPGSATVTYSLHYTDVNLYLDELSCYHSPEDTQGRWTDVSSYSVPLLTSIGLPDGSYYEIATYQHEPLQCSNGSMLSLTLPTKGNVGYTYTNWAHNHRGSMVEKGHGSPYVPGVKERTKTPVGGAAEVWTYDSTPGDYATFPCDGCHDPPHEYRERMVTVTDPKGRKVSHYFSIADNAETGGWTRNEYGLPLTHRDGTSTTDLSNNQTRYLSSEVLDAAGNVERSTYVNYEYESAETGARPGLYQREQASLTKYADGKWSSVNRSSFDYAGHYRQTETDGNFASEGDTHFDHRTEFTDYNSGKSAFTDWATGDKWLLNMFDFQTVTTAKIGPIDALTTHTRKNESCFEADTGFLTRRRVLLNDPNVIVTNSGRDKADLITVFGRVPEHSDADPNDHTGNLYSERSYGGDGANLLLGGLCSITLTDPRYEIQHRYSYGVRKTSQYFHSDGTAMPFFTLDRTIDLSGSVSSERDVAGVETTYTPDTADPLRIKTVSSGGIADVTYAYRNASVGSSFTPAQITVTQSDGTSRVQYDSFGRLWREFRTMPAIGEVSRETLYDSSNRKLSQSMWDVSSYSGKTAFEYDFLGRLDKVTQPDLTVVMTSYLGDSKRTTSSSVVSSTDANTATTPVSTVEQMDRYGRIWYLKEGNDNVTAYGYGVTGSLARVCMNASLTASGVLSTASCGQERTFNYDNRGFLTDETHPENGKVSYTYDALGHILTKRLAATGPFDLNYTYDDAERLTNVKSRETATSSSFRDSKVFTFGLDNGVVNLKRGKLQTATRHNYRPVSGGSDIDIQVTETYEYNDSAGHLTDRTTEIKDLTTTGGINQTVTQKQEYTTLGQISSVTYPSCLSGVGCGSPNFASVGSAHTNGWLTAIPLTGSYAALGYHASGMINTVSHGNGVTDTQAINTTNGMPRPDSITFDGFGSCVAPVFSSSPNPILDDAVIQSGTSKTWTVSASGSAILFYQWFKDGVAVAETSATLHTGPLTDGPHHYFVRVGNSCGMVQSNTATVNVATSPVITVQPQNVLFSPGVRLTVTVSASTAPAPDYQWYRGTGPTDPARVQLGLNLPYFDVPNLTVTTYYFVHVSNTGGSVDSTTATVTVPLATPCCLNAYMPQVLTLQPVHVTWGASSSSTDHYEIWRRDHVGTFQKIAVSPSASYDDHSAAADTAYFYQVCASPAPSGPCTSGFSNQDLATTVVFRDITADRTVRLVDFTQLLTAVNAVRAASPGNDGLPVTWVGIQGILHASPAPMLNGLVYGEHVTALRTQMEAALGRLGFSSHTYTDPVLPSSPRVIIKLIHITELRDRVQ
jgi:YD repeat-containing protein